MTRVPERSEHAHPEQTADNDEPPSDPHNPPASQRPAQKMLYCDALFMGAVTMHGCLFLRLNPFLLVSTR